MSFHSSHRIRSVDALRALAVIPVVLFHLNPDWLPGGYLGVDVFFVISGFLITGIILREVEERTFSFAGFYARRIRRILPALFVMMAVVTAVFAWANPLHLNELVRQVRAVVALAGNYAVRDMAGDYWGAGAQEHPLLHTWSLAVEEQFYLCFPLLIWLCSRKCGRVGLVWMVGGLAMLSLLWYAAQSLAAPASAFYMLGSRSWELLAGALVACLAALATVPPKHIDMVRLGRADQPCRCLCAAFVSPRHPSVSPANRDLWDGIIPSLGPDFLARACMAEPAMAGLYRADFLLAVSLALAGDCAAETTGQRSRTTERRDHGPGGGDFHSRSRILSLD